MPADELRADIEPDILRWIVSSSGMNVEDIAKKSHIPLEELCSWLDGAAKPTIPQLERFAKVVKRPLAAFFLSKPPAERTLPKDYRMLLNKKDKFDNKTLLAIRRARNLQMISKELFENLNIEPRIKVQRVRRSEDPVKVADRFRTELGFDETLQRKAKSFYAMFNLLREKIEAKNILVFQFSMPIEDARGFTLADDFPGVIVVNTKDQIEARIFSLMHEFGHILLGESGVSIPENAMAGRPDPGVERWCNDFASSFLLPPAVARNMFTKNSEGLTQTWALSKMSKTYKVSKAMLLYRMSQLGFINSKEYDAVLKRYTGSRPTPSSKKKKGGFKSSSEKRCLNERGQRFVTLVSGNIEKGLITHRDALEFLSIKAQTLEKVLCKEKP